VDEYIDISVPLMSGIPVWPGSPGVELRRHLAIARGDVANASELRTDVHCGTHVDAPLHFVASGDDLEATGLDPFVGDAVVIDVGDARRIEPGDLDAADVPEGTQRLLLKTVSSGGWVDRAFEEDFPALTLAAAEWVVARGVRLVGIDYLSIQRFEDGPETHQALLRNGVCILEGIDLAGVDPGNYELICLPLRLADAEAAPARAILRRTT
jgi:arylformamidase